MNIFIAKSRTREGPYSLDQLKELIQQNKVSMSDKVYYEGCSDWTRITDLPELVRMVLPPLPGEDSQSLPPPTPSHTIQAATTNPPNRSAIPREIPCSDVSAPIRTGGMSAVQPIPSNNPGASQVDNRFWTKPKTLAGWFGLILLATPIWGLAILFVCLGHWSYVAWEFVVIAGIVVLLWVMDIGSDRAGHQPKTAGIVLIGAGILAFLLGGLCLVVGVFIVWDDLSAPAWQHRDWVRHVGGFGVGSLVAIALGAKWIKKGWKHIS
jgi:hypothetical protein